MVSVPLARPDSKRLARFVRFIRVVRVSTGATARTPAPRGRADPLCAQVAYNAFCLQLAAPHPDDPPTAAARSDPEIPDSDSEPDPDRPAAAEPGGGEWDGWPARSGPGAAGGKGGGGADDSDEDQVSH